MGEQAQEVERRNEEFATVVIIHDQRSSCENKGCIINDQQHATDSVQVIRPDGVCAIERGKCTVICHTCQIVLQYL